MGSRAEQVMKGAIRMVAMRSRLFSIVRVAMIAWTSTRVDRQQRDKAFPLTRTLRIVRWRSAPHRPDSPVFQYPDEQEQQKDLGKKTSTIRALPEAIKQKYRWRLFRMKSCRFLPRLYNRSLKRCLLMS